jgi:hypothetical protein
LKTSLYLAAILHWLLSSKSVGLTFAFFWPTPHCGVAAIM